MTSNPNRFWAIVILLGWMLDFLFWEKPLGINFVIFVTLCLATGIFLLRAEGIRLSPRAGWLLVPIAFLAAMTFFRLEPLTVLLSVVTVLFLLGVFTLVYASGEWLRYRLLDFAIGYLRLAWSVIALPFGLATTGRGQAEPDSSEKRGAQIWPYVRGVVIALPVIAVFAALLSSADPIFARQLDDFIDLFQIENLPEYIFRLLYILIVAYALAGVYLHAAQKSGEPVEEKVWLSPFLGVTEATIVLGSVIVLFIAFVAVQFQYFFGGQANISIEGYTYAEYARKGFGELVTVAFFSLLLLLGLGAITRRETETQRRTFSFLGIGLVVLVLVMLVAAFQRLVLYEAAYGFSRLRTYTHVFMVWLGFLLVVVVVLQVLQRERFLGLAMVLAGLGFVVSLNLLNVDAFIVRQNIQREIRSSTDEDFAQGRADLDAQYFLDLSDDAIVPLVGAWQSSSVPVEVKAKIGGALACKRYLRDQLQSEFPWQGFHFSRWRAEVELQEMAQELNAYRVQDKDGRLLVELPDGEEFSCFPYYD